MPVNQHTYAALSMARHKTSHFQYAHARSSLRHHVLLLYLHMQIQTVSSKLSEAEYSETRHETATLLHNVVDEMKSPLLSK
jgi:hypothetical protein